MCVEIGQRFIKKIETGITHQGTGQGQDAQLVPYQSVLADYQQQAMNQVDREVIPDQERDLVQRYFSALANP